MSADGWPESNRDKLDALFRGDAFVTGLDAELIEWDGGRSVYRMPVGPGHGNFVGTVHGGALFSLADAALGVASNSWGRMAMALTVEIQYLSAPLVGDVLIARAVERSRTRRTAAYAVDITSESDGTLRASFQAMCFRTGRWHLGEDAWPDRWRDTH
ncbi:MAG TPA: PaaI family thioesterase [Acidimicrobiia bacterium]|nr:PaaI family thioesterase [Acidimicrobiia bacterium]